MGRTEAWEKCDGKRKPSGGSLGQGRGVGGDGDNGLDGLYHQTE